MTMLAWGMVDHQDGYEKAGQWDYALKCLKWGADYMIKVSLQNSFLYFY